MTSKTENIKPWILVSEEEIEPKHKLPKGFSLSRYIRGSTEDYTCYRLLDMFHNTINIGSANEFLGLFNGVCYLGRSFVALKPVGRSKWRIFDLTDKKIVSLRKYNGNDFIKNLYQFKQPAIKENSVLLTEFDGNYQIEFCDLTNVTKKVLMEVKLEGPLETFSFGGEEIRLFWLGDKKTLLNEKGEVIEIKDENGLSHQTFYGIEVLGNNLVVICFERGYFENSRRFFFERGNFENSHRFFKDDFKKPIGWKLKNPSGSFGPIVYTTNHFTLTRVKERNLSIKMEIKNRNGQYKAASFNIKTSEEIS
ncbi:hypothetical protein ACFLY7_00840 [Patescibacteria group bacterium]